MDDARMLGRVDDSQLVKFVLAQYGAPACVRRANQVEEEFDLLLQCCRQQYENWLKPVRSRLVSLQACAGEWTALRSLLSNDAQVDRLRSLASLVAPRQPLAPKTNTPARNLRRALRDLCQSIRFFNRRWQEYLQALDLTHVNELRDGYNRYYLLEKECALRSPRLAKQGFRRLGPVTSDQLLSLLPLLAVPQIGSKDR